MKEFLTNFDAQEVVNSNIKLLELQNALSNYQPGSGEMRIHKYALKMLVNELVASRIGEVEE